MLLTSRLKMREAEPEDLDMLLRLLTDTEVNRYIPMNPLTKMQVQSLLKSITIDQYAQERSRYFKIIETRQGGEKIGSIVFKQTPEKTIFGYSLLTEFWGNGFATEAAQAFLLYGVNTLKLQNIEASSVTQNSASGRVLKKCGFSLRKRDQNSVYIDGSWYDEERYSYCG